MIPASIISQHTVMYNEWSSRKAYEKWEETAKCQYVTIMTIRGHISGGDNHIGYVAIDYGNKEISIGLIAWSYVTTAHQTLCFEGLFRWSADRALFAIK